MVQAFWKLKPPVMPSMFRSSPIMWRLEQGLLSMVLKLISFRGTPPQVTNSSLNLLWPVSL